ncbi:OmpW/AlkL family protein [Pseudoteredinibacter isoporae]|uniref:Outer membrane protein n=1 Tax=Pseudoteredinibacter isoporae TaxID=570281 RepID=A0A7X0JSL2_9GAMM|nr:OmpW family outer membrane protein [Pseudoteredinibacter isoporae]MBB6521407.1 outer membrane protein [Pseudoteredinibacter isoporae]NHO86962.1 outer membrane beta-barrel protein [Pseudoteredinibacter isoporae]NIB24585.1 outer membrane beta-barrel protein [Pseudoteredinibacter isoporae]
MKATLKPLTLAAAIAACVVGTQAHAYEAGDFIARAGVTTVAPDGDSTQVFVNGGSLGADSGVDVDNDTQLGLTFTYMLDQSWGVELLAATPFSHDASGKGSFLNTRGVGSVADTKQLPPTLSAVYYFNSESAFKPYVGLGLNYTFFFDEEGGANLEAGAGDLDVDLDDSWGLAAQVGFDFDLGNNLLLNASVRYIDIDTEATLTVKDGSNALGLPQGARITTDVDIDPMVYSVMIGYKF